MDNIKLKYKLILLAKEINNNFVGKNGNIVPEQLISTADKLYKYITTDNYNIHGILNGNQANYCYNSAKKANSDEFDDLPF